MVTIELDALTVSSSSSLSKSSCRSSSCNRSYVVERNISYGLMNPNVNKLDKVKEEGPEDKSTRGGRWEEAKEARSIVCFTDGKSVLCKHLLLLVLLLQPLPFHKQSLHNGIDSSIQMHRAWGLHTTVVGKPWRNTPSPLHKTKYIPIKMKKMREI